MEQKGKYCISPSLMCMQFADMRQTLKTFEDNGIEYLHIDVMDGNFVPNYALGVDFCRQLRNLTGIPLDIHLMIERPDLKLDRFDFQPGEIVSVHYESTPHIQRTLEQIKKIGAKAFVALNPGTEIDALKYLYDIIDGVLVMSVNPGYSGQKLIPLCVKKAGDVRKMLDGSGCKDAIVEIDGNVGFENVVDMRKSGCDMFACGSSSVFFKGDSIDSNIKHLRRVIEAVK